MLIMNKLRGMSNLLPRIRRTKSHQNAKAGIPDVDRHGDQLDYELVPGKRAGKKVITYPGDDDVRIEVFFKDFSNAKGPKELADGRGPVISLLVRDFEVMRFDCLGPTGHCHIVFSRSEASSENRLWLHERSVQAQVERAVFEIAANCNYYLQRNPEEQVREVRLEEAKLRSMCRDAYQVAMSLAAGL